MNRIAQVADVRQSQYVSCHNDLLADNFILASDRDQFKEPMYLIDWEYGGMGPAYYDISDMFQEILVSREIEKRLLEIYFERRKIDEEIYMIDLSKPYPDICWFLWSMIQLNISNIEFDYYSYGKVKYHNAQKNIDMLKGEYGLNI